MSDDGEEPLLPPRPKLSVTPANRRERSNSGFSVDEDGPSALLYSPHVKVTFNAFYGAGGQGTFTGSVANLGNAALGAGILAVPYAFAKAGLLLGFFLNIFFCGIILLTLHATGRAQKHTNTGNYQAIVGKMLGPRWGNLAMALQLFFLIGACVAMQVIVSDQLLPLLRQCFPNAAWVSREAVILTNSFVVLLPLSFIRNIQAMSPLATFSIFAIFFTLGVLIVRAGLLVQEQGLPPVSWTEALPGQLTLMHASPAVLQAVPILCMAYTIHPTYPLVFAELKRPKTLTQMDRATNWAFAGCFFIYACCGTCGYVICAIFKGGAVYPVPGDILTVWDQGGRFPLDVMLAKLAIAVAVVASYTSLHFAARTCIEDLLLRGKKGEFDRSPGGVGGRATFNSRQLALENVAFVSGTMGVSLVVTQLDVVLNFVGALACMPFMFCIPGMLLHTMDGGNMVAKLGSLKYRHNGMAFIIFGIMASLAALTTCIIDACTSIKLE